MTDLRPSARRTLLRLFQDKRGATAVEYGLICALIVLTMIAAFKEVASSTTGMWNNVSDKVSNATGRP